MLLLSSLARTSSGNSVLPSNFANIVGAIFVLDVTAAATDVGDTFDLYIQHSLDGGVSWDDFVHFTQVLGNGGAKRFIANWNRRSTPETEMGPAADATMAAGVKQGMVGPKWRAKWVIVDAGTVNASFTFSLSAEFDKES